MKENGKSETINRWFLSIRQRADLVQQWLAADRPQAML
jgi:hypothetical protein